MKGEDIQTARHHKSGKHMKRDPRSQTALARRYMIGDATIAKAGNKLGETSEETSGKPDTTSRRKPDWETNGERPKKAIRRGGHH